MKLHLKMTMVMIAVASTPCAGVAYGQDAPAPAPADVKAEAAAVAPAAATGHGAIGFAVSTLGFDIEGAVRLASRANVRVGFNFFSLSPSFTSDGINYVAQLKLRSVVAFLDLFPFGGGFHISPGLMIHNGNQLGLNASVPGGQSFTLSGVGYTSSTTTPVTGTGQITFRTTSPALVMGWGNLIPHGSRRWSVPFEMGTVFQGTPQAILSLNGTVCNAAGAGCRTIASDPTVQANVTAEQSKVNGSIGKFKLYPIISLGFAVKF